MTLDEICAIVESATFPKSFPSNLNIGKWITDDCERSNQLVEFNPEENNCTIFSNVKNYERLAEIFLHTHGVQIRINGIRYNIHNSQIIQMNVFHFDDTVEIERSNTRGSRVALGAMLAGGGIPGAVIGGTIGLLTSFGKYNKKLVEDYIVISYWDIPTKSKQNVILKHNKDGSGKGLYAFIEMWHEEREKNENTKREPMGNELAGISPNSGCLGIVALLLAISSLLGIYIMNLTSLI